MFFSIFFAEYSSQLPSDGGTFYHPDTVDNAKLHYKKRWTPILHALAIWLHETGFSVGEMNKESDKNSTVPANAPANMKREEINSDRFYLILGIKLKIIHPYSCQWLKSWTKLIVFCNSVYLHIFVYAKPTYRLVFTYMGLGFFCQWMKLKTSLIVFSGICVEALSNPQTVLTTHAVNGILKALCAVLTSEWPKQQIGVDPILSKEVLNVMHRWVQVYNMISLTPWFSIKML